MRRELRDAFRTFARIERWGTCGYCPRTVEGEAFPEWCQHTDRSDHHLTLDRLVEQHRRDPS